VPPKNLKWPGRASTPASEAFPAEHIRTSTETSLRNLGVERIDLQQLHVWSDAWVDDEGWRREAERLKSEGLIQGFGISVNRWEPANVLRALDTGLVDAVQVVYNIFDQAPEDELFPACRARGAAVIARVPFDEGSLTGTLEAGATWPAGDWRNTYSRPTTSRPPLRGSARWKRTCRQASPCPRPRSGSSSRTRTWRPSSQACGSPATSRPTWPFQTAAAWGRTPWPCSETIDGTGVTRSNRLPTPGSRLQGLQAGAAGVWGLEPGA
jgi:hypothetical protein